MKNKISCLVFILVNSYWKIAKKNNTKKVFKLFFNLKGYLELAPD